MNKSIRWTIALALFATLSLAAVPAAAQTVDRSAGVQASVALETAPTLFNLFEPGPIEQAQPPMCPHGEHRFSADVFPFPKGVTCFDTCTAYCQDNGGYLLASEPNYDLSCSCTCCR